MESSSAWVQAQSYQSLKRSLHANSRNKLKDNLGSRDVLPRRLKFVKAQKECNSHPTSPEGSQSSSTTPPRMTRCRSDFTPASHQLFPESNIQKLMPTMLHNQQTTVPSTIFKNLRLLSKKLRP